MRGPKSAWIVLVGFLAATSAGYWISSVVGTEVLRQEAETQLSTLLAGPVHIERAGLALQGGLFIQGESVGVYPDSTSALGSRLFAERVVAEVDLLALITGRFRLSGLLLEGLTFDIRRDAKGDWQPLPVQALAGIGSENRSPDSEAYLDVFSAFEGVTRTLLAAPIAADRVEVRRSRVLFRDESRSREDEDVPPVVLSLTDVDGLLIHHWLSGRAQLQLSGILGHREAGETPLDIVADNDGAGLYRARISTDALKLGILDPYFAAGSGSPWPEGSLTGSIDYRTDSRQSGTLAVDWTIKGLRTRFPIDAGELDFAREQLRLAAVGQLSPEMIRLTGTVVTSDGIGLGLDGEAERPLGSSSSVELGAEISGLTVDHVREFTKAPGLEDEIPPGWLAAGRAEKIGLSGTLSLGDWDRLVSGELSRLPPELTVAAELAEIEIAGELDDALTELAGRIELRGDTLLLRRGRGNRNGEPLPALNMRINGFSNLFQAKARESDRVVEAAIFAGLDPLAKIFGSDPDQASSPSEDQPPAADPAVQTVSDAPAPTPKATPVLYRIRIEKLEHPSLRWTLRNGDFSISQSPTKMTIHAESMVWGGVPIAGDVTWRSAPRPRLHVVLEAKPPSPVGDANGLPEPEAQETQASEELPADPAASEVFARTADLLPRASGRIYIAKLDTGLIPLQEFGAEFTLVGTSLSLQQIGARLEPRGVLTGEVEVNLDRADAVPMALAFAIEGADMSRVAEIFGIQPGDITGTLSLGGTLEGELRPERPLLAGLSGRVDLQAHRGELRRRQLPLLLALAQASEGYNEYAERDSIAYESMTADMRLGENRIVTRNFELEGPLRIYASGTLDVVEPPYEMIGVAGLFLFRGAGQLLEAIPLVKIILPGSERGLVGAYYQVSGDLARPQVRSLPGRSFAEGLPDALEAPYQILRAILSGGQIDEGRTHPEEPR